MSARVKISRRVWVLVAVAVLCGVTFDEAARAASNRTQYGVLTVSGAMRRTLVLDGNCVAFKLPSLASSPRAKTLGVTLLVAPYGPQHTLLFTVINEDATGQPSGQVNLAATRSFNAQFAVLVNASHDASKLWEGGWWRIQAPQQRFAHYGIGQLTMAASGGSGTIDARLAQLNGQHQGGLTVRGSWNCHHLSQAS
jgi:hypothetical protein